MEEIENKKDATDLIDVSDISGSLEEDFPPLDIDEVEAEPKVKERGLRPLWRRKRQPRGHEAAVADISDRFAAFVIDSTILFYLYWLSGLIYNRIFFRDWFEPIRTSGWHGLVFHAVFLAIFFLYYFISEGIFFATIGKAICRMSVKKRNGATPGIFSIITRTIIRPIDYFLVGFVALFSMEFSWLNQRLGDRLAGTTVVKRPNYLPTSIRLEETSLAPATCRMFAFTFDLILVLFLYFSYLLLLSPTLRLLSLWLTLCLPLPGILYFCLLETFTQTTPGKWLFGYSVFFEDGSSPSFASIFLRTIFRIFDHNPIGALCVACSSQKQRPGDLAAGTIVCKYPRKLKGGIGLIITIVIIIAIGYLGLQNPRNIMTEDFKVNFIAKLEDFKLNLDFLSKDNAPVEEGVVAEEDIGVKVTNFRFAANKPSELRDSKVFNPGETVYLIFEIHGFKKLRDKAWLQEDLTVNYPDNTVALKSNNIVDYNEPITGDTPIELTNNITLPEDSQNGRYSVSIEIRDMYGKVSAVTRKYFTVTKP